MCLALDPGDKVMNPWDPAPACAETQPSETAREGDPGVGHQSAEDEGVPWARRDALWTSARWQLSPLHVAWQEGTGSTPIREGRTPGRPTQLSLTTVQLSFSVLSGPY